MPASSLQQYLISESTTIEFKEELNFDKPKQWLKTVSAFANTNGGTIIVGITDDRRLVGVSNINELTANVATYIKARIDPVPTYEIRSIRENNLDFLILTISAGVVTPYYYSVDGTRTAFVRNGDQSIVAQAHMLNALLLKGRNLPFDAMPTLHTYDEVSFTLLKATFLQRNNETLSLERDLQSFGLVTEDKHLTNAGALLCDQHLIYQSRIFCTAWKKLHKGSVGEDALDDAEFEGNLLQLLSDGEKFIQHNSKKPWGVYGMDRIEHPDYPSSSIREALTNALIHRDYLIDGSEIHIDIYPDRLEITSPGGMPDGTRIQDRDLTNIPSTRRNKVISDIFGRLHFMDRRGSGFERMIDGYAGTGLSPVFSSESSHFRVVFPNINYATAVQKTETVGVKIGDELSDKEKIVITILKKNPTISIPKLAETQKISVDKMRTILSTLKKKNVIEHLGAKKGGYWNVKR